MTAPSTKQERAAARRMADDWDVQKYGSMEEAEAADLESMRQTPPAERLRLVFLLSGQLAEPNAAARSSWLIGTRRIGDDE